MAKHSVEILVQEKIHLEDHTMSVKLQALMAGREVLTTSLDDQIATFTFQIMAGLMLENQLQFSVGSTQRRVVLFSTIILGIGVYTSGSSNQTLYLQDSKDDQDVAVPTFLVTD